MFCERWEKRMHAVTEEELQDCRDCEMTCFGCNCLNYDLEYLDFGDEDDLTAWPDEGCRVLTEEEARQEEALEAMRAAGINSEELDAAMEAVRRIVQTMADTIDQAVEEVKRVIAVLADPLARLAEEIGKFLRGATESPPDEEERSQPARACKIYRSRLRRSRSLRELYGQGFDPGPRPGLIRPADDGLWRAETGQPNKGGQGMVTAILNALLGFAAAVLLIGVIGEKDEKKQRNVTLAFAAMVLLIICMNTIM